MVGCGPHASAYAGRLAAPIVKWAKISTASEGVAAIGQGTGGRVRGGPHDEQFGAAHDLAQSYFMAGVAARLNEGKDRAGCRAAESLHRPDAADAGDSSALQKSYASLYREARGVSDGRSHQLERASTKVSHVNLDLWAEIVAYREPTGRCIEGEEAHVTLDLWASENGPLPGVLPQG